MNFIPLASSSAGNAYLVTAEGVPPLLLECGIPIKQLREKLWSHGVSLSDLAGCLVSHAHSDHSKAVKDLLRAGVDCYMSYETARALDVDISHRVYSINLASAYPLLLPDWIVKFFPLVHDAAGASGFFIGNGNERLLFIPDTAFVTNRFVGVNILAIECNHISDVLSENILSGHVPAAVGRRVRRNHMSLSVVKDFILANNMQKTLREIHLIHLSDANSSEERMIREVQEATGIPCKVAGV
ncbi:MAG: putative metallo-hydrolase YycJ [Syntrophorhabdus sp. PtaU1.Bin050]|nr:MAG: putative metallo-hydrolase YycJ [Syntrophorhabdus sp. PtaU1.Bin050]